MKDMTKIETLNEIQLDALQEIGNIGCSHAATAISQMTNKQINITVPKIKISKLEEMKKSILSISENQDKIIGVYLELTEEFLGSILFLIPYKSALTLSDLVMFQEPGTTNQLDTMGESAIMEVGNVVVSAYTNALGEFLRTTIMLSPPSFSQEMPHAFFTKILKTIGESTTHALIFDTKFNGENNLFDSYFILIPSPESLDVLLEKLTSCFPERSDPETKQYLHNLSNSKE